MSDSNICDIKKQNENLIDLNQTLWFFINNLDRERVFLKYKIKYILSKKNKY